MVKKDSWLKRLFSKKEDTAAPKSSSGISDYRQFSALDADGKSQWLVHKFQETLSTWFDYNAVLKTFTPKEFDCSAMLKAVAALLHKAIFCVKPHEHPLEQNADVDTIRIILQGVVGAHSWPKPWELIVFNHSFVRCRQPEGNLRAQIDCQDLLLFNSDGKTQFTSKGITPYQFAVKVQAYIEQKLDAFAALPESEKTALLLKRLGIQTAFTARKRSWIARPDFWILSDKIDWVQLNRVLLSQDIHTFNPFSQLLPYLLFLQLGFSPVLDRFIAGNDVRLFGQIIDLLCEFSSFARFSSPHVLLRRFIKSNKLQPDTVYPYWPRGIGGTSEQVLEFKLGTTAAGAQYIEVFRLKYFNWRNYHNGTMWEETESRQIERG